MPYQNEISQEEIENVRHRCMTPGCKKHAFLHDWTGYNHCFKHWFQSLKYGSGENNKWFYIRTTKIF